MSDLDGMDAFNTIVDRLVDAEKRYDRMTIAKHTAGNDRLTAIHEGLALKERNGRLAAELTDVKSKLERLEKAAVETINAAKGIPVTKADTKFTAAIKRLDDLTDDIPF